MMQRVYKILLWAILLSLPLLVVQCGGGEAEPTPTLSPPTAAPTVPPTPTSLSVESADTPVPVEASSEDAAAEGEGDAEAYPAPESDEEAAEGEDAAADAEGSEEEADAKSATDEATEEDEAGDVEAAQDAYPEPSEEAATEAASDEAASDDACASVFSVDEPVYSERTNITGTGPEGTEISITHFDTDEDGVESYTSLGEGVIDEDGIFDVELTTPLEAGMFIGIQLASWDEESATDGLLDALTACIGNTSVPNDDPALTLWDATFVVAK